MNDNIILTYGSSPSSKRFNRVLHIKGIDGPDNVVLVNPILNRSDDGTEYEYAEGFKRRITVNLGVVQDRADQLWLWNFFWAMNTKKITYCGESQAYAATPVHAADKLTISGNPFLNDDRLIVESTGTVPTGLNNYTVYYVVGTVGDDIQLSLTSGGAAVTFSDNGTGIVTVIEPVEIDLAVTMEDLNEFILNWNDNIKTAKDIVLSLLEKSPRTSNPSAWS
jgi:hypothetical protein